MSMTKNQQNIKKNINSYDIGVIKNKFSFTVVCACVILNEEKCYFDGERSILRSLLWLFQKTPNYSILYVHDLDIKGFLLLEEVSKIKKFKINFLINKMKIYYLQIELFDRKIEFKCSKKILPEDLISIAKSFNIAVESEEVYNEKLTGGKLDLSKTSVIQKECLRDVELIYQFVKLLRNIIFKDFQIDILNVLSIASLSLKIFSKKFNHLKIPLKLQKWEDLIIREAYYGGRTEVFGNTSQKVYYYDFPGMYGLCMKEKFPTGLPKFIDTSNINLNNLQTGFYSIHWESENLRIPILPIRSDYGKLVFVNGRQSGTYWSEEINLFLQQGGKILKIDKALVYDKSDYVFTEFINYFNNFREKKGAQKLLGKLIINSLYGKLGTSFNNSSYKILYSQKELEEFKSLFNVISLTELNNIFIAEIKEKSKFKAVNVGLAAIITAKARIKLAELMIKTEKQGGRMLYCDTDSLFVEFDQEVKDSFWKNESTVYDGGVFALPKSYALIKGNQSIVKIKGVPQNSITYSEFKKSFLNNNVIFFNEIFHTKRNNFRLRVEEIQKKIDLSNYDKRIFDSTKKNTHVYSRV